MHATGNKNAEAGGRYSPFDVRLHGAGPPYKVFQDMTALLLSEQYLVQYPVNMTNSLCMEHDNFFHLMSGSQNKRLPSDD